MGGERVKEWVRERVRWTSYVIMTHGCIVLFMKDESL